MIRRIFAVAAGEPKMKGIAALGCMLAMMVVCVAVVRVVLVLGVFARFVDIVAVDNWASGVFLSLPWMVGVLVFEILAVPFLMGVRVSPLMRVVSMVAGWVMVLGWVVGLVLMNVAGAMVAVAIMGSMEIALNWLFVALVISVAIGAAWVSWGRWPERELKWGKVSETQRKAWAEEMEKRAMERSRKRQKAKEADRHAAILAEARREIEEEERKRMAAVKKRKGSSSGKGKVGRRKK